MKILPDGTLKVDFWSDIEDIIQAKKEEIDNLIFEKKECQKRGQMLKERIEKRREKLNGSKTKKL